MFQTDDSLYVWTADGKVYGELGWAGPNYQNEEQNTTYAGSFSGYLVVEDENSLKNGVTQLNAVIKSRTDQILGTLAEFRAHNYQPVYTETIVTSKEDAVQQFSYFKTTSTYYSFGATFTFGGYMCDTQNSTFLSFDITLENGTAAEGSSVNVSIKNGGSEVRTGSVTTVKGNDEKIHAKFVAGFPGGTTLSEATVKLGNGDPISFGGSKELEANKIYAVNKTYYGYRITASGEMNLESPFSISIPVTKAKLNQDIPLNTTLGELIGDKADGIKSLVPKDGGDNNIVITFVPSSPGTSPVAISGAGTTVITIEGNVTYMSIPASFSSSDVSLTVEKVNI